MTCGKRGIKKGTKKNYALKFIKSGKLSKGRFTLKSAKTFKGKGVKIVKVK